MFAERIQNYLNANYVLWIDKSGAPNSAPVSGSIEVFFVCFLKPHSSVFRFFFFFFNKQSNWLKAKAVGRLAGQQGLQTQVSAAR